MKKIIMVLNQFLTSDKMKFLDWTFALLSIGVGLYLYFGTGEKESAIWWFAGGGLGVVFSIWRPIDRIKNHFQRTTISKD